MPKFLNGFILLFWPHLVLQDETYLLYGKIKTRAKK